MSKLLFTARPTRAFNEAELFSGKIVRKSRRVSRQWSRLARSERISANYFIGFMARMLTVMPDPGLAVMVYKHRFSDYYMDNYPRKER